MGAIADALVAYIQPLLDQTDGSQEQMNKALAIGQLCYNLALLPKDERERSIGELQTSLTMDDDEFADFRRSIVDPMILRHQEMFPRMSEVFREPAFKADSSPWERSNVEAPREKYPGTDRYAPCPCNSGRKYKFCCGAKSR